MEIIKDKQKSAELPPLRIPFVDLSGSHKDAIAEEVFKDLRQIYKKSQFVLGDAVADFEKEYARLAGCEYAIGVNSGTDGILLTLKALGIGTGDEVITVSHSFIATAAAVALLGAKPVFVDVGWDQLIDPNKIEKAISKRTKAIIPVHLTGLVCQMDRILEIAKKHKLVVIEDSAQAVGSLYKGQRAGSFGDAASFSLHPLKNLHVWGDGGMITTNRKDLAERLKQERNHGLKNRDEVDFFSYNSRLDSVQAMVGLKAVPHLQRTTEARRANAKRYDARLKNLKGKVEIPQAGPEAHHTYHLYVIQAEQRNGLQQFLRLNGVDTKIHYPIPIHLQKAAAYLGCKKGDLPVTEKLSDTILSLPIRENLKPEEIDEVSELIERFYQEEKDSF